MTGVARIESDEPVTTPITFILSGDTLVTVRPRVDPGHS